jgi:XapX domain-containing protein
MKVALGLLLGLLIGAGCRALAIPSPAPPAIVGALLVVAMTVGYVLADRYLARRAATTAHLCGGPTGGTREAVPLSPTRGSRA